MKSLQRRVAALGLILAALAAGNLAASDTISPEEIITRFAARETEFKQARQMYTFETRIKAQVLNDRGTPVEEMRISVESYFTNDGKRHERELSQTGRLQSLQWTAQDLDDALHIQPFVLTTDQIPYYNIVYQGKELVDELNTFVFEVSPKKIDKKKRYFEGKIWVDDEDFQIVKTFGKAVPDLGNNKFPRFETIRQPVDGYWFPVWTLAEDTLVFGNRFSGKHKVRMKELITYDNYKKYAVGATIKFGAPVEPPPQ